MPSLFVNWVWIRWEASNGLFLYLSAFIEAHRNDHYDLLQRVHTHGDWEGWLPHLLTGVAEIATEASQRAAALLAMRDQLRADLVKNPRAAAFVGLRHPWKRHRSRRFLRSRGQPCSDAEPGACSSVSRRVAPRATTS
jgi:Fic family protein